jgi:hypothetical protein
VHGLQQGLSYMNNSTSLGCGCKKHLENVGEKMILDMVNWKNQREKKG